MKEHEPRPTILTSRSFQSWRKRLAAVNLLTPRHRWTGLYGDGVTSEGRP